MGAHITNTNEGFLEEQEILICIFRFIFRCSTARINEDV